MKVFYSFLVLMLVSTSVHSVDQLGRLFTSPAQRSMLEDLRISKPMRSQHHVTQYEDVQIKDPSKVKDEQAITAEGQEVTQGFEEEGLFWEEEEVEEVEVLKEPISLKGIVSRKKGNNTVWINDNNTYEGGMIEENITVKNRTIHNDSVTVKLPDNKTNVTLKVGETYTPETLDSEAQN